MGDPQIGAATNTTAAAPNQKAIKVVYLPTVQACWDFGIARNAPLIPIIGSLLPYNFLRGIQFDTKVFKVAELVQSSIDYFKGKLFDVNSRNEIKLIINEPKDIKDINDNLKTAVPLIVPQTTTTGGFIANLLSPPQVPDDIANIVNYVAGTQVNIALDTDSDLTSRITNTWSGGEDILTQAVQGVAQVAANLTEVGRAWSQIQKSSDFAGVPFSPMRYKGSEYGSITINFTLFTRDNYIGDIYYPLMFLRSICYPRSTQWTEDPVKALNTGIDRLVDTGNEAVHKLAADAKRLLITETGQAFVNFAAERFRIVTPPPTFSVEHSSGLVFMNRAAITEFSYKAEGPWVRYHYDGLFGKLAALFDRSTANALDRLLQDVYVKFPNSVASCYPTRVKCSMTLKETDFITLESFRMREQQKISSLITTSLQEITASGIETSSLIAGGLAQNLDILIPDTKGAGDLLSGGKWVPPGESMTGIPGFL